jgi:hypothetical protein
MTPGAVTHSVLHLTGLLETTRGKIRLAPAAILVGPVLTQATGKAPAVRLMTEAILAPSEVDVMECLLKRLAKVFNHDGGGMGAEGIESVAIEVVALGKYLSCHSGESALELIAYWLEKQNYRVPM